jgi:hypothetical protein
MNSPSNSTVVKAPRRWFYGLAMLLLWVAVAAAFQQKGRESSVAITSALRIASGKKETDESRTNVQQIIQDAGRWQMLSVAAVLLAIVSWGIALWRREHSRWVRVCLVVLLTLYVMLELMMV